MSRVVCAFPFLFSCMIISSSYGQPVERPVEHIIFQADDTQRCLKCHNMPNFAFRHTLSYGEHMHDFSVDAATYKASVHGNIACQQCHTDIKEYPHPFVEERARISCAADCHTQDSTGKKYSHQGIFALFQSSVHKKGLTENNSDSPTCTTCHGSGNPHNIQRSKNVVQVSAKMALCVSCHDNAALMQKHEVSTEAVSSYKRSFHYKAIKFGESNTAVCQDCHTVHHVLPKDSIQSSISSANIATTCGQERCHPDAKMNFSMSGANHLTLRVEREPILKYMERFFMVLTFGTMAMLVVGIVLDIQKTFGWLSLAWQWLGWTGRRLQELAEALKVAAKFGKKILID